MHIGGNDGDLVALVRIGKAGHTGKLQKAVAEPMPARCTKLQHQVGQLAADAGKKLLTCQNLLIQPFAQTFRTVTAKADGFVVIDLHVVNAVGTQKINDPVRQILLHLGLAHIPKAAVTCRDGPPVAGQQPVRFGKAVRFVPPGHLKLEPNAGLHPGVVNRVHDIFQTVRERPAAQLPPAQFGCRLKGVIIVPARVNDVEAQIFAFQRTDMAQDSFLGGLAPGGAELVEQHRQCLFRCGQKRLDGAAGVFCQHLRRRIHTATHGGQHRLGCGEARAGGKGLAPCAELPVCQPAGEGQPPILTVQLHLPTAALRGGGGPCHAVGGVLHCAERHKAAHGKAAHAAEPHTVGGVALPARLQLQILGSFGHQAPLGAPC